jgi:hypothetical protein
MCVVCKRTIHSLLERTMGINIHVYSYWGVRTEWDKAVSERWEELDSQDISPVDDVEILMDGMGSEYMVFGVRLYDSGDSRWGEMINSNEVDISHNVLDQMRWDYMSNFKRLYPNQFEWLNSKPWRLVNLVHYS